MTESSLVRSLSIPGKQRMLMNSTIDCDLLVVGGGLNGTAIARDAAGRGMSVVLCERDDLGAHAVASACGPLHPAVPMLKRQALSTLRKALAERETLMRIAPHAVTPLRLAVPRDDDQQPWRERASRLLADRLAPRQLLPASRHVDLLHHVAGLPLKPQFRQGELVSGCKVDGPRLAVLNAMDAAEAGATILTRTVCDAAQRSGEGWHATLRGPGGAGTLVRSRAMVNATGQWATRFLRSASNVDLPIPLVKCIRLVVRKKLAHPCSYLLRDADGRSVLVLPCENDSTLVIGDGLPHGGEPGAPQVSDAEIGRLCNLLNRYFTARTSAADVAQALPQPHALRLDRTARRCCPCSAATPRVSGAWRKKRWTSWRRCWARAVAPGPRKPACQAARFSACRPPRKACSASPTTCA
jgi:glycerol-3-phosphate dehydrogenase